MLPQLAHRSQPTADPATEKGPMLVQGPKVCLLPTPAQSHGPGSASGLAPAPALHRDQASGQGLGDVCKEQ